MPSRITMNNRIQKTLTVATLLWVACCTAQSQGTFVNLNFESANVSDLPYPGPGETVAVTNGVPGWTIFPTFGADSMGHNDLPLGGAAVIIYGPQWRSDQILEGNYTVGLIHSTAGPAMDAGIQQTGQIPFGTQSIQLYAGGFLTLSFAGQQIPLVALGSGPNYTILGGDISAFAGQTGQLQFIGNTLLDNISFSPTQIPEPSTVALLVIGAAIAGWRYRFSSAIISVN